ncbi:hypothetical protein GCM10017778_69990 [Streptomyces vinaceus]|nr:hypothetical protein GCM10017778_69990 [Streptomyces vinaceus]
MAVRGPSGDSIGKETVAVMLLLVGWTRVRQVVSNDYRHDYRPVARRDKPPARVATSENIA